MSGVAFAEYGKDNVRVFKKTIDDKGVHTITEMTVCAVLQGDIETSYTEADNSVVVATDSIKNTVYIKSYEHPVDPPELFASILGTHFISTYKHIHVAHINVIVKRWARIEVDGAQHPHSFVQDGDETRVVEAFVRRDGIDIRSGIKGLTVLKSTGSAFHGFVRDEYTTLAETWDRILSTTVDAGWSWKRFPALADVESGVERFNKAYADARGITIKTFALDESASVQNTMYKMCDQILAAAPDVESAGYELPNKHYFEIDLSWHKGIKNTGADAKVYAPQSNPNGLIKLEKKRP